MELQQKKITYQQASRVIRNHSSFYIAMQKLHYNMPSRHSQICTLGFMRAVRQQKVYCPKSIDLNVNMKCFSPPPKRILLAKLTASIELFLKDKKRNTDPQRATALRGLLYALNKREADVKWLTDLLGIYAPEDEIFRKSYRYVRPREDEGLDIMLDNDDGLFDDLPELDERQIRKTNRLRLPKQMRQQIKLNRVKKRQSELIAYEQKLEQALNDYGSEDEYGNLGFNDQESDDVDDIQDNGEDISELVKKPDKNAVMAKRSLFVSSSNVLDKGGSDDVDDEDIDEEQKSPNVIYEFDEDNNELMDDGAAAGQVGNTAGSLNIYDMNMLTVSDTKAQRKSARPPKGWREDFNLSRTQYLLYEQMEQQANLRLEPKDLTSSPTQDFLINQRRTGGKRSAALKAEAKRKDLLARGLF